MRSGAALRAARIFGWLLVSAVVVQYYTAGLAIFGAATFKLHAAIGGLSVLLALGLTISAPVARMGARYTLMSITALVLALGQPVLIFVARPRAPLVAALHPVVGLAIGVLAWLVARYALESSAAEVTERAVRANTSPNARTVA